MKKTMLLIGAAGVAFAAAPLIAQDDTKNSGMFRYPDVGKDHILFVYANDIWIVDKKGGTARPVASPAGQEQHPKFSPDESTIAFVGNYEGDRDLYTVGAEGGVPFRVTHHPSNERLLDWTPDGSLMFSFNGLSGNPAQQKLFTVNADGGIPESMPVPYGATGSVSPDGEWLAYTPNSRDTRTWKRYRGGLATDIWLFNLNTNESRKLTDWEGTDTIPMWHKDKLYYLSDNGEESRLNIWRYDPKKDSHEQITKFADNDVKFPSMGPAEASRGEIVFQLGSQIHLLNLSSKKAKPIKISIPGSLESLRPKTVDAAGQTQAGGVSSTGKRVVAEARGDIWTAPVENGAPRQITNTSGASERTPAWSPDGRWISYFSDEGGEYELYIAQSDGKGETRQLTTGNKTFFMENSWSPDSKTIYIADKAGVMSLVDVETGEVKNFDKDPQSGQPTVSWSHDSRWITYARATGSSFSSVVFVYDTETGDLHQVTHGFFNDSSPAFSRKGDYLFYSSNRDFTSPQYEDVGSTFVYANTGRLLAVPLNTDVENPHLLESDDETWEEESEEAEDSDSSEDAEAADGDEESETPSYLEGFDTDHDLWGKWDGNASGFAAIGMPTDEIAFSLMIIVDDEGNISGQSETMGETDDLGDIVKWNPDTKELYLESNNDGMTVIQKCTVDGENMSGTWEIKEMGISGTWTATRSSTDISEDEFGEVISESGEASETVEIDFDGFEARAFDLGVSSGNFGNLDSNDKGELLYIRASNGAASLKIIDVTADEPTEKTVLGVAFGFALSGDGKKLVAATPVGFSVVDAKAGQTAKPLSMKLRKTVDLRDEWRELVRDAWRRQRDFFYVENMHGVDWDGVLAHYLPMVDDAVSREDVAYIIGELISELNVGHSYSSGGDFDRQPNENVGMLGADYKAVGEGDNSGFEITTIHRGAPWDTDAIGPLSQYGLGVSEGDIITSVNGAQVDISTDPWAAFLGLAGQPTTLTIVSALEGDEETINEREITIKPIGSEFGLRYRAWVEANRQYVDEASDGKIGYIYVPNTGVQGQNELFRQFYGQIGKEALMIDERWNGGGQIPNRFIELLNRPLTNMWYRRDGTDWPWPYDAHQGPKAMLINGNAGSGGDMFPWLFKHHGIGKLIGTRTWGGLVGISGVPPLIDGGSVTVPNFGFYELDGTWGIEGHGVEPDIEVDIDPVQALKGKDPQLDVAIDHLLEEIKANGFSPPNRPTPPVRTDIGITEEDK
ncbi:MAG: S41 family peptidase [Phycisphaerales bacterium]|nr:S41 family peptidase [Phycisphaerales bacterium]